MGTSDMAENINKSINLDEYLVIDTTYNELNENIRSDAEEELLSTENVDKSISNTVKNPLAADRSDPIVNLEENATNTNSDKYQNPLAKDRSDPEVVPSDLLTGNAAKTNKNSEAIVQIKIEEMSDDEEVQYVQTIRRDVVQETIDLDTLVETEVAFVRETVPKRTYHGWPQDTASAQRILSFRNTIFESIVDLLFQDHEYIWIDYPLRGAARDFVFNTLRKINRGKFFYTDNGKQHENLMYIIEYLKHYKFYLDYAIKSRGFTIFRNYTKKMPKRPKKKLKCIVKCEPRTPTDSVPSEPINYNNVRVKLERV